MKQLILIALLLVSFQVRAGFLLEPFAGMQVNSSGELDGSEFDLTGNTVGTRLGFQNLGFMVGLDGRRMSWNLETDTTDVDYTFTQLGLFAGYDFPMMLRLWANYVFSLEGINDDDTDLILKDGSGLVFGVGYKVIPFVSLNLEVSNLTTKKFDNGVSEVDYDGDYTSYLLSVSFPLSL